MVDLLVDQLLLQLFHILDDFIEAIVANLSILLHLIEHLLHTLTQHLLLGGHTGKFLTHGVGYLLPHLLHLFLHLFELFAHLLLQLLHLLHALLALAWFRLTALHRHAHGLHAVFHVFQRLGQHQGQVVHRHHGGLLVTHGLRKLQVVEVFHRVFGLILNGMQFIENEILHHGLTHGHTA